MTLNLKKLETLCKKASKKINALARISSYMTFQQRKLIVNSCVISHLSYHPIVWMLHSRWLNNRVNNIHNIYERALRIIYQNHTASFTDLLAKVNSLTIYHRYLQKLVTEMFKVKVGIAQEII